MYTENGYPSHTADVICLPVSDRVPKPAGHKRPPDQKTLIGAADYRKASKPIQELVGPWLKMKKPRYRAKAKRIETQEVRFKKLLAVLLLACTREDCYTHFQFSRTSMNELLDSWHSSKHNKKIDKDENEVSVHGLPWMLSGTEYAEFRHKALDGWIREVARPYTVNEDGFSQKGVYAWTDPEVVEALLATVDSRYRAEYFQKSEASALKVYEKGLATTIATKKKNAVDREKIDIFDWINPNFLVVYRDRKYHETRCVQAKELLAFDKKIHFEISKQIAGQIGSWVRNFNGILHSSGVRMDAHEIAGLPSVTIRLSSEQYDVLGTGHIELESFISPNTLYAAIKSRAEQVEKVRPKGFTWDLWHEVKACWQRKLTPKFMGEFHKLVKVKP